MIVITLHVLVLSSSESIEVPSRKVLTEQKCIPNGSISSQNANFDYDNPIKLVSSSMSIEVLSRKTVSIKVLSRKALQ